MEVISVNEFKSRLHGIFDALYAPDSNDITLSILGDTNAKNRIQTLLDERDSIIQGYINSYNNAQTDEDKLVVIASVIRDS